MRTSSVRPGPRLLPALLVPLLAACGGGAPPVVPGPSPLPRAAAEQAAATITAADIDRRVGALAHDSMRGRDTPSPELEQAANYIAGEFRRMGLEPAGEDGTFIHRYAYDRTRLAAEDAVVRVQGRDEPAPRYEHDYFMIPSLTERAEAPAFYAGVAGEVRALPQGARGAILVFDLPITDADQLQQPLISAIQVAMMNGAAGIVGILAPEFPAATIAQIADAVVAQSLPIPVVGITDEAGRQLIRAAGHDLSTVRASGQAVPLGATIEIRATRTQERHTPPNVVAMLRGSDPALRDTYVVLTAHFDHVGVGAPDPTGDSIFNGADDNASGTAAIMEMAEAFAALPRPPLRSVVFLAVSGEEKGLLGSEAWVEDPTVPIGGIVANINLDMVGRAAPDTVIGIGQEYSTLEGVLREITAAHPDLGLHVILDPEPEKQFFFRSDQLPFIKRSIPAVFFPVAEHEDYHQVSDEPARLDDDKAARVARLGFHLALAIASDSEPPAWTEEGRARIDQILQASPY